MKRHVFAIALALAAPTGTALSADLPSSKAPPPPYVPPPPPILWTGFYGGLNLGGGWSANNNNNSFLPYADPAFPIASTPFAGLPSNLFFLPGGGRTGNNTGGVVGGGQIGYNYQFGTSFLVGAEADIQGTSITGGNQGNFAGAYPSPYGGLSPTGLVIPLATGNGGNLGLPWFGTVRGRAGWLVTPTLLIYGTAGFAYGGVQVLGFNNTRTGWTAGGGVEWMFIPNWSAKLEYLFVDLSSGGTTGAWGWDFGNHRHPQINVVRAGVNYHFNWGAPPPVVAQY
jgi:outer membrane immunogenic protein